MNRADRDRYYGLPTKATPSRSDMTVSTGKERTAAYLTAASNRAEVKRLEGALELHKSLNKLGDLRLQRFQVERNISQEVGEAIALGATWQMIGDRLEVTTQSAWSRYHQIRNPQDPRAASDVLTVGGGIADRTPEYDVELPLE